jgi:hypothetical protein
MALSLMLMPGTTGIGHVVALPIGRASIRCIRNMLTRKNNWHIVYAELLTVSNVWIKILHYGCGEKNSIQDGG